MNKFLIIASLAFNPELRFTQGGTAVFECLFAGERHIVDQGGKHRSIPFYVRGEALGKAAENLSEREYQQGDVLLAEGVAEYSDWNDNDGQKQSTVKMKITGAVRKLDGFQTTQDGAGNTRALGGMNRLTIIGNLGADVEVRYTEAGDAVTTVRVAVNEKFTRRDQSPGEKTHWFSVTLWRENALSIQNLKKGETIFVEGALSDDQFTDKEGNKRRVKVIEADTVYPVLYSTPKPEKAAAPAESAKPAKAQTKAATPAKTGRPARKPAPVPAAAEGTDINDLF